MPKIKPLLEVDRLDNSFRHILAVQMAEYEIKTMSELSERANIKRSTLYRKMRSPGTFLTIELRTLRRVLHISKEQFAEMLGAK